MTSNGIQAAPAPGRVVRILPFSAVDGPGNRAVVFLAGCNFRCLACHNPYTIGVCRGCQTCVDACPSGALTPSPRGGPACDAGGRTQPPLWDQARCRGCDRCQDVCPQRATPKFRLMTAGEVRYELRRVRPFLSGITISGGEPTQQPGFVAELLAGARASGLPGLLESNGSAPPEVWERLIPLCEGVLLDLKAWSDRLHQRLTGAPVAPTLAAIRQLAAAGKLVEVRHLVIPGYTDDPGDLSALATWLAGAAPGVPLVLQAFRSHGVKGPLATAPSPTESHLAGLAQLALGCGVATIRIRPAAPLTL